MDDPFNMTDDIEQLKSELYHARQRISDLNEIIVGDRPDLFHDSLVRGSRVTRMEECISTLKLIVKYIDEAELSPELKLTSVRNTAEEVIRKNPRFGFMTGKIDE